MYAQDTASQYPIKTFRRSISILYRQGVHRPGTMEYMAGDLLRVALLHLYVPGGRWRVEGHAPPCVAEVAEGAEVVEAVAKEEEEAGAKEEGEVGAKEEEEVGAKEEEEEVVGSLCFG